MSSSSKTRTHLTQQQKLRLIKKAESSPAVKYEDLALWAKVEFGLQRPPGKATIGRIISGRIAMMHTVDLLTAMKWCESAWDNVSASTIQKCWLHSTLISKSSVSFILN
ncbi:hypothetical protein PHYSODRAFT_325866 [Phytophthora sojae]|uniref:DDE-1 domain-containing protein n=1 Tax=Phytophthora sojae (strain P6497) TaxID=1094619 RepID=G4YTQ6_PHYSP|nr:hypothetical protein PHYSODRAFT_325866 [Phytophthora sojae]EGZ24793.1 hypothetical protein PHYSODRAFT_325866 [Phytophthora sojae]|eukprot:XP_009520081.1 hypothetical protein PHYSODRAFT_325866 [Phytophthora sojae]